MFSVYSVVGNYLSNPVFAYLVYFVVRPITRSVNYGMVSRWSCGIIQNMNKARQIAPIASAVISGGIMAYDEAAQNAAVHVPSKVDVCDVSGIGESRK